MRGLGYNNDTLEYTAEVIHLIATHNWILCTERGMLGDKHFVSNEVKMHFQCLCGVSQIDC